MPAKTQFAGDGNNQGIDRYEKYASVRLYHCWKRSEHANQVRITSI
ncbi:hypothetical protein [Paenibacillus barcinonensis]|nr:hypothetical protein [Paenibacillus barcinonensis]